MLVEKQGFKGRERKVSNYGEVSAGFEMVEMFYNSIGQEDLL